MNSSSTKAALACEPADLAEGQGHGGTDRSVMLLASSAGRGWSGVAAELRSHSGAIAWRNPGPEIEICVDVHGGGSVVTRRRDGVTDCTVSERGTIWLSPADSQGYVIDLSVPLPAVLHVLLPASQFSADSLGDGADASAVASLRYENSFKDPLVAEMSYAITSELQRETSSGRLLVETLASSLAARLLHNQVDTPAQACSARATRASLDRRRLARVLDYIESNLQGDLTLHRLASIACLSKFHFARAFKAAVGQSPHRYVSAKRLEVAKELLGQGDKPLAEIALALKFSDQASFTRAFRQRIGRTPGQYRRRAGWIAA